MPKSNRHKPKDALDIRLQRLADDLMSESRPNGADTVKQALGAVIELKVCKSTLEKVLESLAQRMSGADVPKLAGQIRDAIAEANKALR